MLVQKGKKGKSIVVPSSLNLNIPLSVFRDRSVSMFEAIVEYLKDKEKMTYHDIALMLNRDDRTIWTVYSRVKNKRGDSSGQKTKQKGV